MKSVILKFLGSCAAAAVIGSGATASAQTGVSANEIVLGMNLSLNGGKNTYGVAALQGMNLYFNTVNASGGVKGRKIVQRVLDDEDKAANAEANARKLVQEGAFILFGTIDGGPSTAVMKVANETNVPFFGPMVVHLTCASRISRWFSRSALSTKMNFVHSWLTGKVRGWLP